jgi:hypothetical protein
MNNDSPIVAPTLATVICQAVASIMSGVHTCMPGQIQKYDSATAKAEVLPLLNRTFYSGDVVTMPVVTNVPVIWPRTSQGSITFPLQKGDAVLLLFAERSIDEWLSNGKQSTPADGRAFDLSDAIAIPGCCDFSTALSHPNDSDFQVIFNENTIKIKQDGTIEIKGNNTITIATDGSISIGSSTLQSLMNKVAMDAYNQHTHPVVALGSPTGAPVEQMTEETHCTLKVKAQ